MERNFIVARYKEDISWTKELDNVTIVQKDSDLPNKGREPSSYLWYIIQNYSTLEGLYTFTQGNPFDHARSLLTEPIDTSHGFIWHGDKAYKGKLDGTPQDTCNIKWFIDQCNLEYEHEHIYFKAGCIFTVSAERIKKHPKEFYEKMYTVLMSEKYRSPWSFERCICLIWGEKEWLIP